MATNYKKKNMNSRNGRGIGSLMLAFVAFILGYLISTIFNLSSLGDWVNKNLLSQKVTEHKAKAPNQQAQLPKPKFEFYTLLAKDNAGRPVAQLPVAKAETTVSAKDDSTANAKTDSTLALNSDTLRKPPPSHAAPIDLTITQNLPLHEPLVAADKTAKQMSQAINNAEHFIVQVASFRNRYEAEKMKAALVLRGFDVYISSSNQQGTWHRVVIGPFTSRTQAQKAQLAFARRQHIMGMIRKMDV